jgi:multidrug resistance efflux pump
MIELIIGTYGFACWLVFKKFKLLPINTYTIMGALLGGVVLLLTIWILLAQFHPNSHDARFYAATVPIVSQVRGTVIEVPVTANTPLKAGDVLFRIDPRPFQYEVDRLEAKLVGMNSKVAQLNSKLAADEAATRKARADLLVSESENDRQLRVALEQAIEEVSQTTTRLNQAKNELNRELELVKTGASSQKDVDQRRAQVQSFEATLAQAKAAERGAEDKLKSGSDRLQSTREELRRAEAQEKATRTELETLIGGVNPDVKQTMAELDNKRWELEQSVVKAPSDGFVEQVILRPGQMATSLPITAPMVFVPKERPVLVASFAQNVIANIEPGLEAELAFKAYPGRIYKCKVRRIIPITPEGALVAGNRIQATVEASAAGHVQVVFDYGDDVANLNLPIGAQAQVAIYTHRVHALSILRKIVLRIKSWENYIFFLGH